MQRKSTKPWILLIVTPFILLISTALLQMIVRFIFSNGGESNAVVTIVNIISLLIGIFSVVALMGLPVWIILLISAISHNKKLTETPQPSSLPTAPNADQNN